MASKGVSRPLRKSKASCVSGVGVKPARRSNSTWRVLVKVWRSKAAKKNDLSFLSGPPTEAPNCWSVGAAFWPKAFLSAQPLLRFW